MGNELTSQHELEKLERRLEEPLSGGGAAALKRHGWDKHNISPHLAIQSDGITVSMALSSLCDVASSFVHLYLRSSSVNCVFSRSRSVL